MACSKEALEISDGNLCGICTEKHNLPRRKLACGHTFCENCLFTFVFDLKERDKLETIFECPVCGTSHPLEETGKVTLEWIQTFPIVTDVGKSDKGSCEIDLVVDDNEETKKCGPCAEEGEDIPGKKYCLECEAYLCDACVATHKKFRLFRSHKLLDRCEILDCENVLADLQKFRKCQKHPERDVELFCKDDKIFICLVCSSTSHKTCTNIVEASEYSIEIQQDMNDLKERIEKTQNHLDFLRILVVDKGITVQAQTETFVTGLTDIKNQLVSSLETLVEKACTQVTRLSQDVRQKDAATVDDIGHLKEVFDKKREYINTMSKYGNSPELCMGCMLLNGEIDTMEGEVLTLDKSLETTEVDQSMIEKLKHVSQQLEQNIIPDVLIVQKASEHVPRYISLIEEPFTPFVIQSTELHTIELVPSHNPRFTGVSVRKDGQLILCDSCDNTKECGFMCVYNTAKKEKQLVKVRQPYYAAVLNTHTVALTISSDKLISVYSLGREMKEERSVTTKYKPRCIFLMKNGKAAISWTDPPGFSIADISGTTMKESQYLTQDSEGRTFSSFEFMAIDEARNLVIQSQPCVEKGVYCFSFTGRPIFKYTNNMDEPRGVAVDSRGGSVFVCDWKGQSIHQLSVTGQPIVVIKHANLKNPLNVCYDTERECLWVTRTNHYYKIISCFKRR